MYSTFYNSSKIVNLYLKSTNLVELLFVYSKITEKTRCYGKLVKRDEIQAPVCHNFIGILIQLGLFNRSIVWAGETLTNVILNIYVSEYNLYQIGAFDINLLRDYISDEDEYCIIMVYENIPYRLFKTMYKDVMQVLSSFPYDYQRMYYDDGVIMTLSAYLSVVFNRFIVTPSSLYQRPMIRAITKTGKSIEPLYLGEIDADLPVVTYLKPKRVGGTYKPQIYRVVNEIMRNKIKPTTIMYSQEELENVLHDWCEDNRKEIEISRRVLDRRYLRYSMDTYLNANKDIDRTPVACYTSFNFKQSPEMKILLTISKCKLIGINVYRIIMTYYLESELNDYVKMCNQN